MPDDEQSVEAYENFAKKLQMLGYERYEVSNFAKQGYECYHNLKYWTGEDYIGFGLSAHSYLNGIRKANAKTFDDYYARKIALCENLTERQLIEEHIMLGLRCNKGIDVGFLKEKGYDIAKNNSLSDFIKKGVIIEKSQENRLVLNPDFYGVNNFIIVQLLPE